MLGYPPGMCLENPLGVGLETPPGQTSQLPPWVWAWRPPKARSLNFPPGCEPGDLQCMLGYQTSPVNRILDTCFWKYYLAATSLRAVIIWLIPRHRHQERLLNRVVLVLRWIIFVISKCVTCFHVRYFGTFKAHKLISRYGLVHTVHQRQR